MPFVLFDHVALRVPDVAAALEWWRETVPGTEVLYADETWGMIEAAGARIAFVVADEHPDHLAFKVSGLELDRLGPLLALWLPGALLGNAVGLAYGARLPVELFRRLTLMLVMLTGLATVVTTLAGR